MVETKEAGQSWVDYCAENTVPENGDPYSTEHLNVGDSFGVCSGCPKVVDQTRKQCKNCLQNLINQKETL